MNPIWSGLKLYKKYGYDGSNGQSINKQIYTTVLA
jgi:hypothetical protein